MAAPSPIAAYFLGTAFTFNGLLSFVAPETHYEVFGLPLESAASSSPTTTGYSSIEHPAAFPIASVSPFVYAKGVRDLCYGLTYFALQYRGLDEAVTVFSGVLCITALVDGLIVWNHGGDRLRRKAWAHWGGLVAFGAWLGWRVYGH